MKRLIMSFICLSAINLAAQEPEIPKQIPEKVVIDRKVITDFDSSHEYTAEEILEIIKELDKAKELYAKSKTKISKAQQAEYNRKAKYFIEQSKSLKQQASDRGVTE